MLNRKNTLIVFNSWANARCARSGSQLALTWRFSAGLSLSTVKEPLRVIVGTFKGGEYIRTSKAWVLYVESETLRDIEKCKKIKNVRKHSLQWWQLASSAFIKALLSFFRI